MTTMRFPDVVERARPLTHDARPPAGWSPSDDAYRGGEDEADYDILRDTVLAAFNPPDDDIAEIALMTNTVDAAWAFIVAQPCACSPSPLHPEDVDVCWRCDVLGCMADRPVER